MGARRTAAARLPPGSATSSVLGLYRGGKLRTLRRKGGGRSGMADQNDDGLMGPTERDLRLDLVRGIGQWMVFLDHIPYVIVTWLTLLNYCFCVALVFLVFFSW